MNWFKELDFYCERLGPDFWAEPLNAISNIFFVFAGLYILNRTLRVKNLNNTVWLKFLSINTILVGIGSFLFHVFANSWSLLADMLPILSFMASYICFVLIKPFKVSPPLSLLFTFIFISLTLFIDQSDLKNYFNGSTTYFPAWVVSCFFAQALYPKHIELSQKIYGATFILALSLFFRSIDLMFCEMTVSGTHYIWHMLNAVVLFTLLRGAYLYSKPKTDTPTPTAVSALKA